MNDVEALRSHADKIRASGVLGRSPLMQRLFDFLLECSAQNRAPKEIEVAVDAFGKGAEFDVSQDAMVRVYIHKLRRKLEEFYAGPGAGESVRLSVPKGEYRFVIESAAAPESAGESTEEPAAAPPPRRPKWLWPAVAAAVAINAIVIAVVLFRFSPHEDEFESVRQSAVWSPLLKDERTVFIVVGDYYIFGETDESMEVQRLVREFNINSRQDLENHMKVNPELAERYMDLELAYLPTAAAFALRDVMPVLAPANKRVRIVTMSQLNPAVLKTADVIYVGYLSGLGMLGDVVFSGSRLAVGDSFDELVDRDTQQRYISQAASAPIRGERSFHDYGYFATFSGPSGNRIIVIAGTRDVAAMHMAETLTSPSALQALMSKAGNSPGFEALYEVYGMDKLNLDGKLLLTSPLDSTRIWTGEAAERHAGLSTAAPGAPAH